MSFSLACPVTKRLCWTWLCWRGCILRRTSVVVLACCLFSPQADAQWHRRGWDGGGIVGGIAGGIVGGIISGAITRPQPYYPPPPPQPYYPPQPQPQPYYQPPFDPVAYCMQRFRSYNPQTGLFVGYDGQFHPCP